MVPGLEQGHASAENGGHSGCCGTGGLATLEGGNPLLEHAHRGVGIAGVDIPTLNPGKAIGSLRRIGKHIAGGGKYRLRVLPLGGAVLAGANRQGIQAHAVEVVVFVKYICHQFTPASALCKPTTSGLVWLSLAILALSLRDAASLSR